MAANLSAYNDTEPEVTTYIREASHDDAPAIAALLLESFEEFRSLYTAEGFAATTPAATQIADRLTEGPTWLAFHNDRLVGTVSASMRRNGLHIRSMAVAPAARGQHIATRLLDEVEQYARSHSLPRLFLSTTPFLASAIRFYERSGFTRKPDGEAHLYGTPIFSMEKHLTAATAASRSTIKRKPERAVPNEASDFLARGVVAHVGFVQNGQPYVIPMTYNYNPATPDKLYLHGSHASRILKHLVSGAPICVTVTALQGLVYSKTAAGHSINYETVICFGKARPIKDLAEKTASFQNMIGRYHAGRTVDVHYEAPTKQDLMSVSLVEMQIEEISAKARRGGPLGPGDTDPDYPGTSGVRDL